MDRSNPVSFGRLARCEALETRNLFADVGLDPAFRGGSVQTYFGYENEGADEVVSLKDGRVAAAGHGFKGTAQSFLLAVYNKDGTLSNRFDGDGKLALSPAVTEQVGDYLTDLFQTPDGGILLLGNRAAVKLKLDGKIDTAYGKNGFAALLGAGAYIPGDVIELSDGTTRQIMVDPEVNRIYLRDINVAGQIVKTIQRKPAAHISSVDVDATGLTVVSGTTVYRYRPDLSTDPGFGKSGAVDLVPFFNKWADGKGPWTMVRDERDPLPTYAHPPTFYASNGFFDAKTGYGVRGSADYVSDNTETEYPSGPDSSSFTALYFNISTNGKSVTVADGRPKGAVLAHPYVVFDDEYGDFEADIYAPSGVKKIISAFNDNTNERTPSAWTAAADGSVYIVGQIHKLGSDRIDDYGFGIVHVVV